jgi:hypothetical protein
MDHLLGYADPWPASLPEQAQEVLGSRGLLSKDPATRLALCAIHRALGLPARVARSHGPPDPRVGVVASSNFGNVSTVASVVRTLRTATLRDVSALDAPNVSSNVIASTASIWFRYGGPNLMICSGSTSGLDAVRLAINLLRARRADRVVVVGVEPADEDAQRLHARRGGACSSLVAGAAAVILELESTDVATGPTLEMVGTVESPPAGPTATLDFERVDGSRARRTLDVLEAIGDIYGAIGVIQVALAAAFLSGATADGAQSISIACGDSCDGLQRAVVHASRRADAR